MRWLDGITIATAMRLSKDQEIEEAREAWCAAVHGITESDATQRLNNNQVACQRCLDEPQGR